MKIPYDVHISICKCNLLNKKIHLECFIVLKYPNLITFCGNKYVDMIIAELIMASYKVNK